MDNFNPETAVLTAIAKKSDLERLEDERFQQSERRKLSLITEEARRVSIGKQRVAAALEQLKIAETDEKFDLLAEGYALQGDFPSAVIIVRDAAKRAEYLAISKAINRDDTEVCACPKTLHKQPTFFVKDRFYEANKYREVVNLWYCVTCGFMNASP